MNSHIQTNKEDKKTLVVFYDNEKADYDEQTSLALKRHGLPENTGMLRIAKC